MSVEPKGLLLVLVDPAATLEEELNDWYDTEHLPERKALPGFETALRLTCIGDGPRYAALYDLTTLDALATPEYNAVSGANFSPWTRRVTSRSHPLRITARQVNAEGGVTRDFTRLLMIRFRQVDAESLGAIEAGLKACFASAPGFRQLRLFACQEPDSHSAVAIIEFFGTALPSVNGAELCLAGTIIDLVATYRPYRA